jgi:colanic acid/amylovoran biosynthesis glycosyltransferase
MSSPIKLAYLANQFPSAVEPYVREEIEELRRRGLQVIAGSALRPGANDDNTVPDPFDSVVLQPFRPVLLLRALWMCMLRRRRIADLLRHVLLRGRESPAQRLKALLHTWLGAYYALRLEDRGVEHIHVHHGYFGSWIGMVAARLLDVGFSMTLHGSDLLLHGTYLGIKLENCRFCLTISEYNRRYILEHYAAVDAGKILVARLGVEVPGVCPLPGTGRRERSWGSAPGFVILSVGRLHDVKNHAFLVRACAQLRAHGLGFKCFIAGEGPERHNLESLIRQYAMEEDIQLLGQLSGEQINSLYGRADVVVLTSRSEGLPLVLMEAMARGKIVLAPAITGIPELVAPGKTGFLYHPGSLDDLVERLLLIRSLMPVPGVLESRPYIPSTVRQLDWVRHAARVQVCHNYNLTKNLESFADLFIQQIGLHPRRLHYEDFVLQ